MSDQFAATPDPQEQYAPLARWLYHVLASTPQVPPDEHIPIGEDVSLPESDYHSTFYPQIPDFAMALLKQDPQATTRFAPLLFHLLSCPACHQAYLETYDALRAALDVDTKATATYVPSSANPSTASPKMLVFLCQLLIGQARTMLRQAHRDHSDKAEWARSLLQQAMQASRHLMQGAMRQRALRDLVEVALLAAPAGMDVPPGQASLSYAALTGSASSNRGHTVRRTEMISRANEQIGIDLQASSLDGRVTQEGEMLILHLHGLQQALRGKMLLISVPLGTLLEPVRWLGGNPYAIRSSEAVAADGSLTMPLGRTDLLLTNPEERNLIEILFKRLDVYPID